MIALFNFQSIQKCQNKIRQYIVETLTPYCDYMIDSYKSDKLSRFCSCEVLKFPRCNDSWHAYICECKGFIKKHNINELLLVGVQLLSTLKIDNNSMMIKALEIYHGEKQDKYSLNFDSTKRVYEKLIFIICCRELGVKLFHFVIDPQEADIKSGLCYNNSKRLFILNDSISVYAHMYEAAMLCEIQQQYRNRGKTFELFFIASCLTNDRKFLYDIKNKIKISASVIFDIIAKSNAGVAQGTYYSYLSRSKYTIVVKPYKNDSFSIIRFIEAIVLNCVPLILDDVCLDELKNTFADIYELAKDLVCSADDINSRLKK